MDLQRFIQILIYVHAALGGLALLSGATALIAPKGKKVHILGGKVFYFSMLLSAATAMVVALLPKHESPFLFAVGIFSSYFVLSGMRSLRYKNASLNLLPDKILAIVIILAGLAMILVPIFTNGALNIVLLVFGLVGIFFGIRDMLSFRNLEKLKQNWLTLHLGKMLGGYISAVSAFFVVNEILPGIWNWFTPGILGGVLIFYWVRKMKGKASV